MPPKSKASSKASSKATTAKATTSEPKAAPEPPPKTAAERSAQRFFLTNPLSKRHQEVGILGLTPAEKKTYIHANLVLPVTTRHIPLTNKTEREFWKVVSKEGLSARRLPRNYAWGSDRHGRDIGSYGLDEFEQRSVKSAKLAALDILHRQFLVRRDAARRDGRDLDEKDVDEEKKRRQTMAALRHDLYGLMTGSLAKDPAWDDVVPIPQDEPDGALAQIAYPDDYAEAVSYLRAVMAADECSPRCLRLTELVITMNPAHYTVWLYRFKIISVLRLSVPDEIRWLNEVALANLKNYQIWNHRQLLMDYYYPAIQADPAAVKQLARSETDFIALMLDEDTKNYHVWTYRQYLVGRLGMWDIRELAATQGWIETDVRNNSAWSHRFFLVFSDPAHSTPGSLPNEHDPLIPESVLDREIAYAKEKIELAPQNQSPWNYILGALKKGGREVSSIKEFAEQFVSNLGEEDEDVRSSHALDALATAYAEEGDVDKAKLCLRRLCEKWDPIRSGFFKYRTQLLEKATSA